MSQATIKQVLAVCALVGLATLCGAEDYELAVSTYLGGTGREDTARAVAVDGQGNIFVAGGTRSADFPTTPNAYDRTYDGRGGSAGPSGPMDAFIMKLDPEGKIVWSTLLGGPNYDRIYTVRVDRQGFIYAAGRAGEGFPTTPGTVQPEFCGDSHQNGAYGKQDGFITKLSPDGSRVIWSTYFGTPGAAIIRDMDLDLEGNLYIVMIEVDEDCPHVTAGAFQAKRPGGRDSVIAKLSPDAGRVLWCSYLGGTGRDLAPSLRVGADGCPVVAGSTFSTDFPVTEQAYQRRSRGKQDAFVVKFAADGSRLLYSTLLGGADEDGAEGKHGLVLDKAGRACVAGFTSSADFPVTPDASQTRYAGGTTGDWRHTGDRFVAILSADGSRLDASTLIGGGMRDGGEGIDIDGAGRILLGGMTYSADFPVTANALQRTYRGVSDERSQLWGGGDATVILFSPDLKHTLFSTYLGGSGEDLFRACAFTAQDELVLVGYTTSRDWPLKNAMQSKPSGGPDEIVVTKLRPRTR